MAQAWKHTAVVALLLLAAGCVMRTIYVRSQPDGAAVWLNGNYVGKTPLKTKFYHYGTHLLILRKQGYESIKRFVKVSPPWYEVFPLDFFFEVLFPFVIEDTRKVEFTLKPAGNREPAGLLERAEKAQ